MERPVETVHHLQLAPQFFLGEVVEHAGIYEGLHEVGAILGQTQAGQPFISHPLVVHVSVGQDLQDRGGGTGKRCIVFFFSPSAFRFPPNASAYDLLYIHCCIVYILLAAQEPCKTSGHTSLVTGNRNKKQARQAALETHLIPAELLLLLMVHVEERIKKSRDTELQREGKNHQVECVCCGGSVSGQNGGGEADSEGRKRKSFVS